MRSGRCQTPTVRQTGMRIRSSCLIWFHCTACRPTHRNSRFCWITISLERIVHSGINLVFNKKYKMRELLLRRSKCMKDKNESLKLIKENWERCDFSCELHAVSFVWTQFALFIVKGEINLFHMGVWKEESRNNLWPRYDLFKWDFFFKGTSFVIFSSQQVDRGLLKISELSFF